jgi:alpha-galactosidase
MTLSFLFSLSASAGFVGGLPSLAATPLMGWNSWYAWNCKITDAKVRAAADVLVSSGLAKKGYRYVNIDDCWQGTRDSQG